MFSTFRRTAWLLFAVCGGLLCARPPDLVLEGELSGADHETYRLVPFTVPPGVARLTVAFAYTGREQRTTIDLGLVGPEGMEQARGFRGWSGGNKSIFTVSAVDATPSYLPGPIVSGEWALLLGIPNHRRDVRSHYTAEITFSRTLAVADEPEVLRPPLKAEAGWYRGDFHAHTAHSDGWTHDAAGRRIPAPVFLLVDAAEAQGLDFVAVTEHNTPSAAGSLRELQPLTPHLLLIPGQELTTFQGHANALGTHTRFDFRVTSPSVPDWNALAAQVAADGALLSINHPIRPSGEACMGCGWKAPGLDFSRVQAVEVVNGRDADTPYSGIPFWHELLNQGYRITGIGGSDTHGWRVPLEATATTLGVGHPTTVVKADELSVTGILEGVRRGRVCIDVSGSRDRRMEFVARAAGVEARMGGELRTKVGTPLALTLEVEGVDEGQAEIIINGEVQSQLLEHSAGRVTGGASRIAFSVEVPAEARWIRANLRDVDGQLLLVGNPIYLVVE